ncbi:hypothetical protein J2Z69_002293 [Paenibacillus shirakamiensis]|uniref:Uncharacterized protein n=1 Tax=Paenibacillus shirakamiensis TaxID=1265935 RepID=A0ABS4JJF6_9BACL|nr:hypothetical protein [Paenibacillus shirakamiensis]MBP2001250.1 hypothetical protein [Paenibacillus shirakamiensis]
MITSSRFTRIGVVGFGLILLFTTYLPCDITAAAAAVIPHLDRRIASAHASNPSDELQHFAEDIVHRLSNTESFGGWSSAELAIEALGPGTHAWLVTVGSSVGYLIISAKEEGGYALIEYGRGSLPLFGRTQLDHTLTSLALNKDHLKVEKFYAGPTLAQWKLTQTGTNSMRIATYLDALSGELLPETDASIYKQRVAWLNTSHTVSNSELQFPKLNEITANAFNPYDNMLWLTRKAVLSSYTAIPVQLMQNKQLVFTSQGGTRTYSTALPLNGMQRWTGSPSIPDVVYLFSQSETSERWIALSSLEASGQFYNTNP